MNLLGGGQPSAVQRIEGRGRAVRGAGRAEVLGRAALYEHLQELHKNQAAPAVLFADGVDARLVADAADLPRLRILLERRPGADEVVKALAALGIPEGRVARPGAGELEEGVVEFD